MTPDSYPVKVGVIGIGNMGWHHARVLSLLKDANLIGVADPNEKRGQLAKEQFQCDWYSDYNKLLSKVDAICIAVPTLLHHQVGLDSLKAGVHVLIEKPIAASQAEAASLISVSKKKCEHCQSRNLERMSM